MISKGSTTLAGKGDREMAITTKKQLREIADSTGLIKRNGRAIRIYENGDILRADVRADLCQRMTVKAAVKALKL